MAQQTATKSTPSSILRRPYGLFFTIRVPSKERSVKNVECFGTSLIYML